MRVADLGEFSLIQRLTAGTVPGAGVLLGAGDDAAVWESGDMLWMATADTMVDGVHFLSSQANAETVGWKAGASNASDINAMGGEPRFALVTLGLPPDTSVEWTDGLYRGLNACGAAAGFSIIGGDIVRAETLFISITLVGSVQKQEPWQDGLLLRKAARPGDFIAVSGTLGGSAGGLRIRLGDEVADQAARTSLLAAHDSPQPPFGLGKALVGIGVRCGMDLSDGLAGDLKRLADASGTTMQVTASQIPVHPALQTAFGEAALPLAVAGGEDYNLLITCAPDVWVSIPTSLGLTAIGEVRVGPARVVFNGMDEAVRSWDHLA